MAGTRNSLILFLQFLALWSFCKGQDCVWDKDVDFPTTPPLMLDSSLELIQPVLEGSSRIVRVSSGSEITLACSGQTITALGVEAEVGTCAGGTLISIGGTDYALNELGCSSKPKESILKNTGTCGDGSSGHLNVIGFNIATTGDFYGLIQVCFDKQAETTLYTQHILHGANIAAKDIESSRPSFKTDSGFFTVSMDTVYAQASQLELMTALLGDADLANQIIDTNNQLYFAKGHMSPDADFVTIPEQDATYYFINAVPQWQAFNNGNWKYLEYATRDLAQAHGTDITVYSGGWDVLELDDINGNPVQIYLGLYEGKTVVPAPALTWKVVYEASTNKAAAVVGINNPHLTSAPSKLCTDICSSLSWIDMDFGDLVSGYTYCCTVDDLRSAIPNVPDLGNVGILDS